MSGELEAARAGDERAFASLVQPYRRELRAYCYRMAASMDEADDLLQECLLRAWRGLAGFEGRSSLRTWLYRVAFSACADELDRRGARLLATSLGPPADPQAPVPPPREERWIGPCPADLYASDHPSPEARYSAKESVAFAFLAALQHLPPKQRAILLLRDVMGWSAEECAELLETSVASANSALQRARETMEARSHRREPRPVIEDATRSLLARYVDAWDRADVGALVALLREDSTLSMPPIPIWLRGAESIGISLGAMVLTPDSAGCWRFLATEANGLPAIAVYRRGETGAFGLISLTTLKESDGYIAEIVAFLDPRTLAAFSLPATLDANRV